jgi:ABC-type dipeptide/oligopeptide/nickel transport system permease component
MDADRDRCPTSITALRIASPYLARQARVPSSNFRARSAVCSAAVLAYTARRVAWMVPLLFFASLVVFVAAFALPEDPVQAIVGARQVPEATRRAVEAKYGLDDPLPAQYVNWAGDLVRGDLGRSYQSRRPVTDILVEAMPNSLRLAALAVAIELVLGVAAGIVAAVARRPFVDVLVTVTTLAAIATPVYVLALLFQWTFGLQLEWLPAAGTEHGFRSWVLPAVVLAVPSLAYVARLTRDNLRHELRQPYTHVAESRGLSRRQVVERHALRNAMVPVVTFVGLDFGVLLGGAVVVEALFDIRGMGFTIVEAVRDSDHTVVIGASLVMIAAFLLVNLVVDVVVAGLDPRVRRR